MNKWNNLVDIMVCPICGDKTMYLKEKSIYCQSGHCFDISRKGYLNLLRKKTTDFYSSNLFENRKAIYELGFYHKVLLEIERLMLMYSNKELDMVILDAGCGEGYWLSNLNIASSIKIGIDISKQAIYKASRVKEVAWLVADLTSVPLKLHSVDTILSIFTPSNYQMFEHILKPKGIVIKVVPTEKYLIELRRAAGKIRNGPGLMEDKVFNYMRQHMEILAVRSIEYQLDVNSDIVVKFVKMTPMLRYLNPNMIECKSINKITISVNIIVGRKKGCEYV